MKAGLLGHGTVGKGVTEITDGRFPDIEITRILVKSLAEDQDSRCTENVDEILEDGEIGLIIECMGGMRPAFDYVRRALESGRHVITSNKKMLASHFCELASLAREKNVSLRYEACAGGGIPWIHEIKRTSRADEITAFRGILNGTTNYILSAMEEKGLSFAEALARAQRLGYAEADPGDDIDGYDTRYKTVLTAAAAFGRVCPPEEIPVFGIRHLEKEDMEWAEKHGRRIRLLAGAEKTADGFRALVMPRMLKTDDPFSTVKENLNLAELSCRTLGRATFGGQGAGSLPTGHAVVQDMLEVVRDRTAEKETVRVTGCEIGGIESVFYVRTSAPGLWRAYAAECAGNVVITKKMDLRDFLELAGRDSGIFAAEAAE